MCKTAFPEKAYVNLEDPADREFAETDPRGFIARYPDGAVIDEIQRAPDLASSIQVRVDLNPRPGQFILTGSHNMLLLKAVSQSLAGRTALCDLLPFSLEEIRNYGVLPSISETMFRGFFPRVLENGLDPMEAGRFYVNNYIERDLRQLLEIRNLRQFEIFLKLCAGRTGQLLNLSALGAEAGVTHNTAKEWISILEASYLVRLVPPWYRNLNKRLVKAPKLFFLDTSLACSLMGITEATQLDTHPLRGALFETMVASDLIKRRLHRGYPAEFYHLRDSKGLEVDLVYENQKGFQALEIKSGMTPASDWFDAIRKLAAAVDFPVKGSVIYGGNESYTRDNMELIFWKELANPNSMTP